MRLADAPREGWYPDPDSRTRLRWWDGTDWADIRRAPPSNAELINYENTHPDMEPVGGGGNPFVPGNQRPVEGLTRNDAQEIIAEVRNVARAEVDRAAQEFSQRATNAARSFTPLITEYTTKITRWIKLALGLATVLFIAWLVFQAIAQQSLFEWIGDRIDNLTDENSYGWGQAPFATLFLTR